LVSYRTARKESAERPPLQTVPGQREGENRNEQLAVVRQPRARPALLWLRRASGEENRIDAAIAATVNVVSVIAEAEMVGGDETSMDERTVNMARITPAASVVVASPTELVSGDAAEELMPSDRNRDHGVDPDDGDGGFDTVPDTLGKGGCRNRTDAARAM
jgi:hypothetical protein